jgi:hypothetical protein
VSRPAWVIDGADDGGAPTAAHCERCGFGWSRPDGDPHAVTLPEVARWHICRDGPPR